MISEYSQKRNLVVKIQDIGPLDPASPPPKSTGKCEKKNNNTLPLLFFVFSIFGFSFSTEIKKTTGNTGNIDDRPPKTNDRKRRIAKLVKLQQFVSRMLSLCAIPSFDSFLS